MLSLYAGNLPMEISMNLNVNHSLNQTQTLCSVVKQIILIAFVNRAYYIIEICLLQLHFSITRNGVFYKDLYIDTLLQDLHNIEQSVQS